MSEWRMSEWRTPPKARKRRADVANERMMIRHSQIRHSPILYYEPVELWLGYRRKWTSPLPCYYAGRSLQ